jgi:hypothetical protein
VRPLSESRLHALRGTSRLRACALIASGLAPLACDAPGESDDLKAPAPMLRLLGTNAETRVVSGDGAIELGFAQYIKPLSAIRQSFLVRTAQGTPVTAPLVAYDPVTRIVRIENPEPNVGEWFREEQFYTLTLGVPQAGQEPGGFRTLVSGTLPKPVVYGFKAQALSTERTLAARIDYCKEIAPVFTDKCTRCHGTGDALDLASARGIDHAKDRVARSSVRSAGRALPPGKLFGADMPLLESGSPGTSFLLYKALRSKLGTRETPVCGAPSALTVPIAPFLPDPGDAERAVLADLVGGQAMPPPNENNEALTFAELRRISTWIRQGATTAQCGPCVP